MLQPCLNFNFVIIKFQLRVTAIDDADPGRMATADVTILVQRNANAPKFSEETYRVTLSEKATLGDPVIKINATDEDKVCIFWLTKIEIFKHPYFTELGINKTNLVCQAVWPKYLY